MNAEFDYDLDPGQWEALKALRGSAPSDRASNRWIVDNLVTLGLAEMAEGRPALTSRGRSVLLRGSPRLMDLAA